MGRHRINEEQTPARLPAGTLERIDAVDWQLVEIDDEDLTALLRIGVSLR